MTSILLRRGEDTQKEEGHVKMGSLEMGVIQLQAKEWQTLLGATLEEARKDSSF